MANADTVREIRAFIRHGVVHRGRIAPSGPLGESFVASEDRADRLVDAGALVLVDTLPSGTRWFKVTTRGRNLALVGVEA